MMLLLLLLLSVSLIEIHAPNVLLTTFPNVSISQSVFKNKINTHIARHRSRSGEANVEINISVGARINFAYREMGIARCSAGMSTSTSASTTL
jgi:hypothetical protein